MGDTKVYKAKRRVDVEGRDKPYWNDAAFTVLLGEYDGKKSVTLVDERTGIKYPCFEPRKWDDKPQTQQTPPTSDAPF